MTAVPTGQYIPPAWPYDHHICYPTYQAFPTPMLLKVVAAWSDEKGRFRVLEDGREYQEIRGEWAPVAPPLSDEQRMPR